MDLNPDWEYVADTVMGGVSTGAVTREDVAGREAARLSGEVSLDNNGGFIQMAFDLAGGDVMDVSGFAGVEMQVYGNGAGYELRLRTDQLSRPWQSFRAGFDAPSQWQTLQLPWAAFEAHRTDAVLDPARLRRMGVLAIGSEMQADIAIAEIGFFR
jgi:hypothetical protein